MNYQSLAPFATSENGVVKGVEADIVNEYILWLKTTKKMNIVVKYVAFANADALYTATKKGGKNAIGIGGIVVVADKQKEFDYTAPHLKNVSFCITNGNAPDIKAKTQPEIVKGLGSMTALTVANSNLAKCVADIKKTYVPDLKVNNLDNQVKILDEVAKNVLSFAFVDAIEFWFYLKANPGKFLKMQKALNQSKDNIAFVLPKGSQHKALFNEFFSGPTGFKANKNYRTILEKYVGSYMTQNLAVN